MFSTAKTVISVPKMSIFSSSRYNSLNHIPVSHISSGDPYGDDDFTRLVLGSVHEIIAQLAPASM